MSDLIDRQAAIEHLKKRLYETELNSTAEHPYYAEIADNRIDVWMNELPSAPSVNQWIPCSERLPNDETDILVTYVDGEETRIVPVNYGRGIWFDCIFDRELNPHMVTAWMPLPGPWKGEDNA